MSPRGQLTSHIGPIPDDTLAPGPVADQSPMKVRPHTSSKTSRRCNRCGGEPTQMTPYGALCIEHAAEAMETDGDWLPLITDVDRRSRRLEVGQPED